MEKTEGGNYTYSLTLHPTVLQPLFFDKFEVVMPKENLLVGRDVADGDLAHNELRL